MNLSKIPKISLIYALALGYFVLCVVLTYIRWRAHFPSLDYHSYLQMFWNTTNGDILIYNRNSESLYSLFAAHFAPILLMMYPFYYFFRHPLTLYFVFFAIISTSVIPLYYFALDKLKNYLSAWLVAITFLIYFPFTYTHLHGFAEEALATPLLLFAFFSLYKNRQWFFIFFCFLTLSLRIDMVLPVFLLGVYAVIRTKFKARGVFICLLSILWLFYIINIIYPKFSPPGERFYVVGFFASYGDNIQDVIKNVITHPLRIIEVIKQPVKLAYIRDLFGPLLFLSFLAPEILFVGIFTIILNMLGSYPRLSSSWTYYHSAAIPFIWLGFVLALEKLGILWNRFIPRFNKIFVINALLVAVFLLNLFIIRYTSNGQHLPISKTFNKSVYEINVRDQAADKILRQLPAINSIATNYGFLEHTAERKWHFPAAPFRGYLVDLALFDPFSLTGEIVDITTDTEYKNILEDSFIFLSARRDLIKTYDTRDFINSKYKDYYENRDYLLVSKPLETSPSYSGVLPGTPLEINKAYQLVQKLEIKENNPTLLEFPVRFLEKVFPKKILWLDTTKTKAGIGNLKIEILEGTDFKSDNKVIYTHILAPKDLTYKTTIAYLEVDSLELSKTGSYWLKLSLENGQLIKRGKLSNGYGIFLAKRGLSIPTNVPTMFYSLNGGKTWSSDLYPERNFMYSLSYKKLPEIPFHEDIIKNNILTNGTLIIKGSPIFLKGKLQEILRDSRLYKQVTIVGSITEKL